MNQEQSLDAQNVSQGESNSNDGGDENDVKQNQEENQAQCDATQEKFIQFAERIGQIKFELVDIYQNNSQYKFITKIKLKEYSQVLQVYQRIMIKHMGAQSPRQNWSDDEIGFLIWITFMYSKSKNQALGELEDEDWAQISQTIPFKTGESCQFQWLSMKNINVVQTPWTQQEDQLLTNIILNQQSNQWNDIAKDLYHLSNQRFFRQGQQCRQRWNNYLDPCMKRGEWSDEQDYTLIMITLEIGLQWSSIAKRLTGRTENAVQNRYQSLIKQERKYRIQSGLEPRTSLQELTEEQERSYIMSAAQKLREQFKYKYINPMMMMENFNNNMFFPPSDSPVSGMNSMEVPPFTYMGAHSNPFFANQTQFNPFIPFNSNLKTVQVQNFNSGNSPVANPLNNSRSTISSSYSPQSCPNQTISQKMGPGIEIHSSQSNGGYQPQKPMGDSRGCSFTQAFNYFQNNNNTNNNNNLPQDFYVMHQQPNNIPFNFNQGFINTTNNIQNPVNNQNMNFYQYQQQQQQQQLLQQQILLQQQQQQQQQQIQRNSNMNQKLPMVENGMKISNLGCNQSSSPVNMNINQNVQDCARLLQHQSFDQDLNPQKIELIQIPQSPECGTPMSSNLGRTPTSNSMHPQTSNGLAGVNGISEEGMYKFIGSGSINNFQNVFPPLNGFNYMSNTNPNLIINPNRINFVDNSPSNSTSNPNMQFHMPVFNQNNMYINRNTGGHSPVSNIGNMMSMINIGGSRSPVNNNINPMYSMGVNGNPNHNNFNPSWSQPYPNGWNQNAPPNNNFPFNNYPTNSFNLNFPYKNTSVSPNPFSTSGNNITNTLNSSNNNQRISPTNNQITFFNRSNQVGEQKKQESKKDLNIRLVSELPSITSINSDDFKFNQKSQTPQSNQRKPDYSEPGEITEVGTFTETITKMRIFQTNNQNKQSSVQYKQMDISPQNVNSISIIKSEENFSSISKSSDDSDGNLQSGQSNPNNKSSSKLNISNNSAFQVKKSKAGQTENKESDGSAVDL